jgi:AcrR family transcriptional regulator
MPYPAKTSAEQILAAAVDLLEREGQAGLTVRGLAAELKVTPNALYRYYPSREALLAAVAVHGATLLLAQLSAVADELGALAAEYLRFAALHPALYDLYMTCDSLSTEQQQIYSQLWTLVVERLRPFAGPHSREAAMTLWAYLHGLVGLERSGVYEGPERKPRDTTGFGLEVLLAGLRSKAE